MPARMITWPMKAISIAALLACNMLVPALSGQTQALPGTYAIRPGPLPGHGLAEHPFVYCGEFDYVDPQQTIYIVRDGQVAWTYSIPTRMMVHGKSQMAELGL